MKKFLILIGLVGVICFLSNLICQEKKEEEKKVIKVDFEFDKLPSEWKIEGTDFKLAEDIFHSGKKSLYLGNKTTATFKIRDENVFGKVTIWVYDMAKRLENEKSHAYGPRWGLMNDFSDKFVISCLWAPYITGNITYGWISTAENAWYSKRYTGARREREPKWRKWVFDYKDKTTLQILLDPEGDKVAYDSLKDRNVSPIEVGKFDMGFNGIYLYGGDGNVSGVYIDDIEIEIYPKK
ncbi:MAG: hypothetical protein NC899_08055 [Candidatus Omnitrophica bacterium]|nr:hypothetical protein [Candidatus Omnitrophota bacterium]MCM8786164.1 hypothetical protein [Candidatus Omnitrophota bacterium]